MNDSGVKIEVHLIQNFAPSNLNRDDTGQPKSATFGGFRRARVSSQCGKRAAREWWRERGTVPVGDRTRRLQKLIADKLDQDEEFKKKVPEEADRKGGVRVFTDAYYAAADKKASDKTSVLIFVGPGEVDVCAEAIKELWDDENRRGTGKGESVTRTVKGIGSIVKAQRDFDAKNAKEQEAPDVGDGANEEPESGQEKGEESAEKAGVKNSKRPMLDPIDRIKDRIQAARVSADIALFGRMLAEQPGRNTDGACQVAHPISTHKVDMEMDYYTAVDDLNPKEETGAGMMGVVGFNSACYYRYALVDRDQLARNLARKTERERKDGRWQWSKQLEEGDYKAADSVIKAFLEAVVYAIPTGKQNSFAAQNLPSFGLFVRRQGGVPISLANAFAKPVRPTEHDDDLVGLSLDRLTKHWDAINAAYGNQGVQTTAYFHVEQEGRLKVTDKDGKGSTWLSGSERGKAEEAIEAVLEVSKP